MNNILQLKGQFQHRENSSQFGPTNLPKGATVTVEHIKELKQQLERILEFWKENQHVIGGALVSVHYIHVVAKSNRLKTLLGVENKKSSFICGAKFVWEPQNGGMKQKHIFTHFINLKAIQDSIRKLNESARIVSNEYGGRISNNDTEQINNGGIFNDNYISKSAFLKTIVDAHFVEKFNIDYGTKKIEEESIITIYKTGIGTLDLLQKFGIDMINAKMIDDTTLRLNPDEIRILQEKAPYLISMDVKDFSKITREDILSIDEAKEDKKLKIPKPGNEPVIGVIDTHFDKRVYFHEWVDYENKLSSDIEITEEDFKHGTAVSSIIVDGPALNPSLNDGCGRFKVKHFGVAKAGKFSSFTVLKLIRTIVAENTSIKVWNLSLGSAMEIDNNFISPEAAELDKIQSDFDVIFIIAGTNKQKMDKSSYKIGAPADSLNSLVVNAVDFSGKSASYTRVGPVLSFFHKPDLSYYGGDGLDKIVVCDSLLGKANVMGTSFAAPWITRKVAYLIYIMGLSREVAKALIIDSAAGWNRKDDSSFSIGYGIVPKRIEDILHSKDDEIRFIMTGAIDEFETYTYNIPVPQEMNAHPYFAKATLVYFPKSDRNQGVDYTSTEMDIHFGRIKEKDGKPTIQSIDCNKQADDGRISIYEEEARKMYRKWDNVKHISETIKKGSRPRKAYDSGMWGLSIKTKERLQPKAGRGLQFGVVVTLKEMNGVNRIDDFIKMCMVRGWLVNKLDIDNQFDVYKKAEEDIKFE